MTTIARDSVVDQLVTAEPKVVNFLIQQGLPCVVCGEPFWGTVEELARSKGWDDAAIDQLVEELQARFGSED